jgi:RNA polymerase sigma factor (sigma-70 family)
MTSAHVGILRHLRRLVARERASPLPDQLLLERFRTTRDESAFAELVRRHGPMVLHVGRSVLHHGHDAEDVFQAAFLLLARKAASLHTASSVGGWLHRVAYHLALKARARAARRREHEGRERPMAAADPLLDMNLRDLQRILHEELQALPDKYRTPLVLCYLEGKSQAQAAQELGWSRGAVRGRLDRGRARLRARLSRRGLSLSFGLLATALATRTACAVPGRLAQCIVRLAAGPADGAVPAEVAALVQGASKAMFTLNGKITTALLLAAGLVAAACTQTHRAWAQRQTADTSRGAPGTGPQAKPAAAKPPAASEPPARDANAVAGRVLGADGKPLEGARVAVLARPRGLPGSDPAPSPDYEVLGQTTTDKEGRFRLELPAGPPDRFADLDVIAGARGLGLGGTNLDPEALQTEAAVQLTPEQVIRGRLVDLGGNPARGVTVRVLRLWRGGLRAERVWLHHPEGAVPAWPGDMITDEDGRFNLRGVGKNWQVVLGVNDERFARQDFEVATGNAERPDEAGLTLEPARFLEGTVTAADTGKPVANVRVAVQSEEARHGPQVPAGTAVGKTDDKGRYRILTYRGNFMNVSVLPPEGVPYLPLHKQAEWDKGVVKKVLDLALPSGVLVRGKVTEAGTGKPVAGAVVGYRQRWRDNPFFSAEAAERFQGGEMRHLTAADGSFQLTVLPGPGHMIVKGPTLDYVHLETTDGELEGEEPKSTRFYPDGLAKLDLKPDVKAPQEVAIELRRGETIHGRVVDPDGNPVARAQLICRSYLPHTSYFKQSTLTVHNGAFDLQGCDPEKTYTVYVLDTRNQVGATAELNVKEAAGKPVTVRLAPCGTTRIRLVDARGKPFPGHDLLRTRPFFVVSLMVTSGKTTHNYEDLQADTVIVNNLDRDRYAAVKADEEGRLTVPLLIPGAPYRITVGEKDRWVDKRDFTVKAGETADLGELVLERRE